MGRKLVNHAAILLINGLVMPNVFVVPPNGTLTTATNYTFTATCQTPGPTFVWTPGSGVTIVSGQNSPTVTVSFSSTGMKTLTVVCTNSKGLTQNGAWIGTVV